MKRTYKASCHCGSIRFEADLDLGAGTVRCNCSMCAKLRAWLAAVGPNDFRLLAGKPDLTEYRFGAKRIRHVFCRTCGVRPFGQVSTAEGGVDFYAVNLAALDDADAAELANAPVMYVDGRNDNWQAPPAETRHL